VCMLIGSMSYAEDTQSTCTLWQLPGQTRTQMNSYVIRTPGNELIVIDGGTRGDAAYLRTFIRERGNHVHAWFISHTHSDHVDALTEILNNPEDMTIDRIYGSFPDDAWMEKSRDTRAAGAQRRFKVSLKQSKRKLLDLSPGQKIEFTGVTFEILSTLNPELSVNPVNNQSAVWRVDVGDTSILFLGDLGEEAGDKLLAGPYRDRLKADYVQMAHHGQTGVSEAFYRAVNPKQCLWPTPDWLWDNNKGGQGRDSGPWKTLEVRAWMDKLNIEKHYIAKDGMQRIDIPADREGRAAEQSGSLKHDMCGPSYNDAAKPLMTRAERAHDQ
jgi:beta-lactamase superfamily II metal-dependent hydrolase